MILDSSVIVAVICREPDTGRLLYRIRAAFLFEIQAVIVPFGRDHISAFFEAFLRFGKGRHPARLNMGDCLTYAVAKLAGMPVLFTGTDFSQTDLDCA